MIMIKLQSLYQQLNCPQQSIQYFQFDIFLAFSFILHFFILHLLCTFHPPFPINYRSFSLTIHWVSLSKQQNCINSVKGEYSGSGCSKEDLGISRASLEYLVDQQNIIIFTCAHINPYLSSFCLTLSNQEVTLLPAYPPTINECLQYGTHLFIIADKSLIIAVKLSGQKNKIKKNVLYCNYFNVKTFYPILA